MTIEIICPVYNGEEYIEKLYSSLLKQQKVKIKKIMFLLTESNDNSLKIIKKNKID